MSPNPEPNSRRESARARELTATPGPAPPPPLGQGGSGRDVFLVAGLALAYFFAHQIAFFFPDSEQVIMLIWPAGGVGLAAFLLNPRRLWPALTVAFYGAGVAADVWLARRPWLTGLGYMTANMVESIGCAWLILRVARGFRDFTQNREVLALIAGAVGVNAFSSCIGAGASVLTRGASFVESWSSWYVSDGLGVLVVGPFLVSWLGARKAVANLSWPRRFEGMVFIVVWSLANLVVFGALDPGLGIQFHPHLLVGLLVWAALRLGQPGVTLALMLLFAIGTVSPATVSGPSPWDADHSTPTHRLLELQLFLGFMASVGYLLAASIADRRRAEEALRLTRFSVEHASDALFWITPDARLVDVNEAACRSLGYARDELLRLSVPDVDLHYNAAVWPAHFEELRQRGSLRFESVQRAKDGRLFPVEIAANYVRLGAEERNCAFVRDITERKRAEEDRQKFVLLADSSSEFIGMCDLDLQPLYVNPAGVRMVGLPDRAAACRVKVQDYFFPEDQRFIAEEFFPRVMRDGHGDVEIRLRHFQTGKPIWMFYYLFSVRDASGTPVGWATVSRDITQRRQAEQEREIAAEVLRLANTSCAKKELIQSVVTFFRQQSGCEAVGVRLREGEDYPYYQTQGFSADFVRLETHLCDRNAGGELLRDSAGNPVLECMCGNVIRGRFDPARPFFTPRGSFWTNSTSQLLASTTEADRQARTRNRCNSEGYESVALIPLRLGNETCGLLQLNDRRPGLFTVGAIQFWERLADILAVTFSRLRTEEVLRESEAHLRRMAERMSLAARAAQLGIWDWDIQTNELTWDDRMFELYGIKRKDFSGAYEAWLNAIHPDDRARCHEFSQRALRGEVPYETEFRVIWPDGSVHYLEAYGYHLRAADGTPLRQTGINLDITERRQAAAALAAANDELRADRAAMLNLMEDQRQAQADYAMLFEKMLDGFALHEMIFDAAGRAADYRFLAVNPSFERMTGLRAESVVGKTVKEVLPGIEPFWIETYGRVVATGEPAFFQHFSREVGRHFEVAAFSPSPGRFACVFVDVTEQARAAAALQRNEAELSTIYEHVPFMMCLLNGRREVERANRALVGLVGGAPPQDARRRLGDVLGCLNALDDPAGCGAGPHCHICPLRLALLETFETGQPKRRVEAVVFLARNGVRREVRVSASTAMVRIGGEDKLLLCLEDITAHKQLEAQFLQAQKMEAVGQLAGGVAHDFNNILAATLMHLHLLREIPGLDAEMAASLTELESHAHRAANLTRQLLMFSRRGAVQPRRLDLHALLEDLMKMLRRLLGEHIEIVVNCAPPPPWLEADPGMLEQVIVNLCVNARDAMPKGGRLTLQTAVVELGPEEARVHAEARLGRFVCLSVSDNGCGMDEATLRRIFEPFFTTKEVGKGTGLGLATVYGVVRQHQGWVTVQSAVGVGTTFRVFLPAATSGDALRVVPTLPQMPKGQGTILVVEDDSNLLKAAARVLRGCGYRVLEARNGVEALNLWEETGRQAQLVLTDIVMPGGVGGLELVDALRRRKPGLKVIMTSGYSGEPMPGGGEAVAGAKFLPKPYTPATLARIVRECLEGKE